MATGADEVARGVQLLTASLIEAATKLAFLLIERRAQRLREAARQGERKARQERARLDAHRAADAAIWRRTASPAFWRKATPEQVARAWQAASTWHESDPEAAGARQALAERLRRRGVDVAQDVTADPGDAKWLQTALDLADAEREEQAAFAADLDSDLPQHADQILWNDDELPLQPPGAETGTDGNQPAGEVVPPAPQQAQADTTPRASSTPATGSGRPQQAPSKVDDIDGAVQKQNKELARMEAMLRQAWPAEKANRVLTDQAWQALARSMQRLDREGKNVPELLNQLPYDTTEAKIPAMLTEWTLRKTAAGPVQLRRAEQQRAQHLQRKATAIRDPLASEQTQDKADKVVIRAGAAADPKAAARLRTAFPISTKQALNGPAKTAEPATRPGGERDRARSREQAEAARD